MSPQEEILAQVKFSLENSAELTTLIGSAPETFYCSAPTDTPCPYFIYDIPLPKNVNSVIWEGDLYIKIWFYAKDSSDALEAENIISQIFNSKIINGTTVRACRIWLSTEGRNQGVKKDSILHFDAIFIRMCFELRWSSVPRNTAAEFTP